MQGGQSATPILNEKGASLTPGAYVGVAPVEDDGVDFAQRMKEIHKELLELQAESKPPDGNHLEESGGDGGMKWEKVKLGNVTDSCLGKMLDQNKNKGD